MVELKKSYREFKIFNPETKKTKTIEFKKLKIGDLFTITDYCFGNRKSPYDGKKIFCVHNKIIKNNEIIIEKCANFEWKGIQKI